MSIMSTSTEEVTSEPEFLTMRNFTNRGELDVWCYILEGAKYKQLGINNPYKPQRERYRQRRGHLPYKYKVAMNAFRIRLGNSDEIGAFSKLTNSYFLVGGEDQAAEPFCRTVSGDLFNTPVIRTSLVGCRIVGRLCVGNKHGLIVPEATYDTEIQQIKEELPESVKLQKVEERLSALGNVVVCNDNIALIHPDLDKETEEIIANTLQVEVFRSDIGNSPLVGSYCVLNNYGGLVNSDCSEAYIEDLSSLLDLQLFLGTVNRGNKVVASGLLANDHRVYTGMRTSGNECVVIDKAFYMSNR